VTEVGTESELGPAVRPLAAAGSQPETVEAARAWDEALTGLAAGRGTAFLRAYSDAVNGALVRAWLPPGLERVLKTDLFDEAVGAGLVPLLRERAREVIGVDVSPAVVAAAQARYPELGATRADVRALGLSDASVDAVVSNSTLDHFASLDELVRALAEIRRVLAPGGRLLLTLDNGANPLVALRNALPRRLLRRLGLVSYPIGATCGPKRLERLLEDAGFAVEDRCALMHFPRVLARLAAAAAPSGSTRLLDSVLAFERLGSTRARYVTAQFVGALARKR
jgi:SAM-dependent methyltransferase